MTNEVQAFIADTTTKSYEELIEAYMKLPEEKQIWKPESTARTAKNQFSECCLINSYIADLILSQKIPDGLFAKYPEELARVENLDNESLTAMLKESSLAVIASIHKVESDSLNQEIELPWGIMTLSAIMAYPSWNMAYHLGQINYIASMLPGPE